MDDIRFRCRACDAKLKIDAALAGAEVACPHCRAALVVPGEREADAASRPAVVLSVEMRFLCPRCQTKLRIDVTKCGTRAACPSCAGTIQIPAMPPVAPSSPALAQPQVALLTSEEIEFLTTVKS